MTRTVLSSDALWVLLGSAGFILPLVIGGWLLRKRYREIPDEPPVIDSETSPGPGLIAVRLGTDGLGRGLRDGIAAARRELADDAIAQVLATVNNAVLEFVTSTVRRAVKTGHSASLMIRCANHVVYTVALPVRLPRPQTVRRYLGAAWPDHLAAIQRAANGPVLALAVLCPPDASEASLLVGFAPAPGTPSRASVPELLLEVAAARALGANRFRHVINLSTLSPHEV